MTVLKNITIVGALWLSFTTCSALSYQTTLFEKILGYFSQSYCIHSIDKNILGWLDSLASSQVQLGTEDASELYQKLAREAQQAVGVPKEWYIPIKKIDAMSPLIPYVAAIIFSDALYVNEERLNNRSYGACRCILFHEAVHRKYNDRTVTVITKLAALVGSAILMHYTIKAIKPVGRYKVLHGLADILTGLSASAVASTNYITYRERRADIEGHYATHCSQCVHESAAMRRVAFEQENNRLHYNNGYLSANELEMIAYELEQHNELCEYHKRS